MLLSLWCRVGWALFVAAVCAPACAGGSKLLLTGGVSTIDGAAGGGLTPWALVGSYAAPGEWGATAHATTTSLPSYGFRTQGVALAWSDRLEFSLAQQDFDTRDTLAPLGLPGLHLKQRIAGVKWRVAGEAILDSDTPWPQLAVGLISKRLDAGAFEPVLTGPLGARTSGTEFYASATKLLLGQGLLVNLTLRASDANQNGLVGFGGAQAERRRLLPEASVAWLLQRGVAVGVEARRKPNHLNRGVLGEGALREDDWFDAFVAWAPNKHVSVTAAWVDLGRIVPALQPRRQTGGYLSLQVAL